MSIPLLLQDTEKLNLSLGLTVPVQCSSVDLLAVTDLHSYQAIFTELLSLPVTTDNSDLNAT